MAIAALLEDPSAVLVLHGALRGLDDDLIMLAAVAGLALLCGAVYLLTLGDRKSSSPE